jgi:hypothetical protein
MVDKLVIHQLREGTKLKLKLVLCGVSKEAYLLVGHNGSSFLEL